MLRSALDLQVLAGPNQPSEEEQRSATHPHAWLLKASMLSARASIRRGEREAPKAAWRCHTDDQPHARNPDRSALTASFERDEVPPPKR
jgi:hypothetical protein